MSLAKWEHLHTPVGAYDGGKCLSSHEQYYEENNSCSHRWQAVHRALGPDLAIYESHPTAIKRPSQYEAQVKLGYRTVSASEKSELSTRGALLGTPKKKKKKYIVRGKTFRTAYAPYNNNPHHLLPDAELRGGVFDVTAPAPQVQDLIFQGLLDEGYNLNHWKNIMILPQETEDGCALGLPTHPKRDIHRDYSREVRDAVITALKPYETVVDQVVNEEEHDNPDPEDLKNALERISDKLHTGIVANRPALKSTCASGGDITVNSLHPSVSTWVGV